MSRPSKTITTRKPWSLIQCCKLDQFVVQPGQFALVVLPLHLRRLGGFFSFHPHLPRLQFTVQKKRTQGSSARKNLSAPSCSAPTGRVPCRAHCLTDKDPYEPITPPQPALHPLRPTQPLRRWLLWRSLSCNPPPRCPRRARRGVRQHLLPLADLRALADVHALGPLPLRQPSLDQLPHPRLRHSHLCPRHGCRRLPPCSHRPHALGWTRPTARVRGAARRRPRPQPTWRQGRRSRPTLRHGRTGPRQPAPVWARAKRLPGPRRRCHRRDR